jgi:transposase
MANVDKESVREKVDEIKRQFEQLRADQNTSAEVIAMFSSMMLIIDLILSIFMEKQTKKNSKNSSIPSSQTPEDETSLNEKGSKTKGKCEKKTPIFNTRTVETTKVAKIDSCNTCGADLTTVSVEDYERRTKIDIIFEKVVENTDAEIKQCPKCKTTNKARFPDELHGPLQYGNGLKAYIINLLVCQMVALNRVQKLMTSMIGQTLSESTLLNFISRLHQALEGWEKATLKQLLKQKSINVDETGLQVNKKKWWVHVYSSGEITLKFVNQRRGKQAIEEIGIIETYTGVIIHDRWSSYLSYTHCGHGLCGSHLLRDLVFIEESNGYRWATNMKRLLQETCHTINQSEDKKLTNKAYADLQKRYRNILTRGEKELPEIPPKPKGKRGKLAKSDGHNLWEAFKKHEKPILLFTKDPYVSFTNNRAERDLRMTKVKQKVSGCFRTPKYAEAYCRISSYLQTMANKGYNPLVSIQMALSGDFEK